MKKKIVFTCFAGSPTSNQGGPNNIIRKLLEVIDYAEYEPRYISKNNDFIIESSTSEEIYIHPNSLYYRSNLFRTAVSTPLYLRYHYYKGFRHFLAKNLSVEDDYTIHSHDVLSFYNFQRRKQNKILTIHSKGSIISDFGDYHKKSSLLTPLLEKFKEVEMESINNADYVTFPSVAAKELFLEEVSIKNEDKIRIVYNGINLDYTNAISLNTKCHQKQKENFINIFNVADHIKAKNVDLILHSIKILKERLNKKISFTNAGTGPLTRQLLEQAKELNIGENVKFVGKIPNYEIIKLMNNCDYFISLAERVIFDLVILEAMACGMVIIASNRGGNKEVIRNGENGYLIDDLDPENIANTILEAKTNCGVNAKDDICKYSSKKMMNDYYKLYNS